MWSNGESKFSSNPQVRTERSLAGADEGFCLVITDEICVSWVRMYQHFDRVDLLENYDE